MTLKAHRVNKGWTQNEAASRIEISKETLANYENVNTFPDVPTIEKAYGVKYSDIIFLTSNYRKTVKHER